MNFLQKKLPVLASLVMASCAANIAVAQSNDYPNKPIKIIVGFTPGGSTDAVGRQLANSFTKILGQSVIVENKPGANANLATDFVRRAAPDGYTIFYTSIGHVTNPLIYKEAKYDPVKDFTPIGQVLAGPNVLVIPANSRFKTLKDLIDYGKANPGKINFASSGVGSSVHLSGELFKQLSGVDMVHIPYKGTGSLLPHLMSGTVDLAFPNLPTAIPLIEQGQLRALGVTTNTRSNAAPKIPTIAEGGLPTYDMSTWYGLVGPANLPPEIQKKLSDALMKTLNDPEFKERLIALGMDPRPSSPQDFAKFIQGESAKWSTILKDMNFNTN
ncbi:Bug family tripartite tricarboxylate transporter substrate binding protein [Zwartia panacis]|uniref:Bug family tripartite tricarboxylate transporter substrate binding protein n=1 Tax=Zwartia panacis TaxID=2683345 RepID=UPI0025B56D45|nr:tripartite tricarboxylate transporter substrate binding protein [Zwartia panacis]MDN4016518.1 tripartite tricarboxylate transporter substrate binding protein [Zwartia panacis]